MFNKKKLILILIIFELLKTNISVAKIIIPQGLAADLATTSRIKGDYDGNGTKENAWITYKTVGNTNHCYINFSDAKLKRLQFNQCYAAIVTNKGDINGNKTDELSIVPGYITSNWQHIEVYGQKSGVWSRLAYEAFHLNLYDQGMNEVIKKSSKKGYVKLKYTDVKDDGEWVNTIKTVKLR
jgi:hypothetical protein